MAQSDEDIVFVCGRFGGIDQRFIDKYVDEEYSLGDFVISGGELACLTMADSVVREIEGSSVITSRLKTTLLLRYGRTSRISSIHRPEKFEVKKYKYSNRVIIKNSKMEKAEGSRSHQRGNVTFK